MNLVGESFARDAFARALSADALVRAMLDFERALASAEADAGVIPLNAARAIAAACSDLRLAPDTLGPRRQEVRLAGGPAGQGAH